MNVQNIDFDFNNLDYPQVQGNNKLIVIPLITCTFNLSWFVGFAPLNKDWGVSPGSGKGQSRDLPWIVGSWSLGEPLTRRTDNKKGMRCKNILMLIWNKESLLTLVSSCLLSSKTILHKRLQKICWPQQQVCWWVVGRVWKDVA